MLKRLTSVVYICSALCYMIDTHALNSADNWGGCYLGSKMGAALEQFDLNTSVSSTPYLSPTQISVLNAAGQQSLHPVGFLAGIEAGYNWQFQRTLLGIQTDIQALSNHGVTNSGAILDPKGSGNQFVLNSYANNTWLFTARPRLGLVTPYGLIYGTGGLGLTWLQSDFVASGDVSGFESQQVSTMSTGYAVGGGIETAITKDLSLKIEYLYESFPSTQAHLMNQFIPLGQAVSNTSSLDGDLITLGLNYHFNQPLPTALQIPSLGYWNLWQPEIGVRVFGSSGTVGAPQPLLNSTTIGDLLASRLSFYDLTNVSGEAYARFDHSNGVFVKGFLGAGTISNGQLNDEDFPAAFVYSNTLSHVDGNLSYGVIDLGYAFLENAASKTGVFVGYDYNAQNLKTYHCRQIAGDVICLNPNELSQFLALSDMDTYYSLRVGLSSQLQLTERVSLAPEVAYLPVVSFNGLDMHNARQLLGPERSNHGDGTMIEGSLDYQWNDTWRVGIGGRYWTWNMHNGSVLFEFIGDSDVISEPARFNTTRYGGFLQINYHHQDPHSLSFNPSPMQWDGLFVGVQVGGAWGNNTWSDPFGASIGGEGYVNSAGFGDSISSSGPLGGGSLNLNWQKEDWVYGVGGSISGSDIRGENTVFSGIGGINGQSNTNYLGTLVGRLGYVLNDSLIYIHAGTAVLNTQYTLTGSTVLFVSDETDPTLSTWGWTVGAGLEYAFNDRWISSVEYEYIGLPKQSIFQLEDQTINADQSLNVIKVGIGYKLDGAG